jgi:hypothetical protein
MEHMEWSVTTDVFSKSFSDTTISQGSGGVSRGVWERSKSTNTEKLILLCQDNNFALNINYLQNYSFYSSVLEHILYHPKITVGYSSWRLAAYHDF